MPVRRLLPFNTHSHNPLTAIALCAVLSLSIGRSVAQSPGPSAPAPSDQEAQAQTGSPMPQMGGVNTGGTHAAVLDKEHRPITAGGFVKSGPIVFQDIAQKAGLTAWKHTMGTPEKHYIIETNGSGVGLIDYDNDGWLDIYLVNGSTAEALAGKAAAPKAALFHNNHDGTFTDVTEKAGVTNDRWGIGVAIADYDNDGWPDIYVTNFGKNRLYHNNHDGTFTDVAEKAGVTLGNWSTGATWGDYDGDGRLDLFVPGYVHYDMANQPASQQAGRHYVVPVPRRRGDVWPAWLEGRGRSPVSQQRGWHLHRCQREGRRQRQERFTMGWPRCLSTSTMMANQIFWWPTIRRRTISISTRAMARLRM